MPRLPAPAGLLRTAGRELVVFAWISTDAEGTGIDTRQLKQSGLRSMRSFLRLLPVLAGVLLLAGLLVDLIPQLIHMGVLGHGRITDMLGADLIGSLATGQPVVSHLLAGELRKSGVDL